MRGRSKYSICDLCSENARKRCKTGMTRKCESILRTFEKADTLGAKYHLFASGNCIFAKAKIL